MGFFVKMLLRVQERYIGGSGEGHTRGAQRVKIPRESFASAREEGNAP